MNEPLMTPHPSAGASGNAVTHSWKRRRVIAVLSVAILALVVSGGIWARHRQSSTASGQASTSAGEMAGMPGMSNASTGSAGARLTSGQLRQFGVTFGSVEQRPLMDLVRAIGTVAIDETRLTQVTPRFGGFVERLHVDKSGQRVARGQPLMEVYSPEIVAAQQELLVAANLQKSIGQSAVPGVPGSSIDLVASAKRRLQLWDVSDAQIDEVLRTGQARRTLTLYAPASGVILEKNVISGQSIQPGQMLYTIGNLDAVWIDVALREADAGSVRVGSHATADFASLPGRPLVGRVTYLYPTLDSIARTMRARIEVANLSGFLRPGMYATVTLTSPTRAALTVPTSALVRTGERTLVFVEMAPSPEGRQLMPNEIEVGRTAGDYMEVLAGLEPGQRVVTSAQFLLDSESNLAEVMKSMIGQIGAQDVGNMKDMPGMELRGADVKGAIKRATNKKGTPPGMKTPPERR